MVLKADQILKDHFQRKEIFSDFINGIMSPKIPWLSPQMLHDYDTDMSTVIVDEANIQNDETIDRRRDVIFKVENNGFYVLMALENQDTVDTLMAYRNLLYDVCAYQQQIRDHEKRVKEFKKNARRWIN